MLLERVSARFDCLERAFAAAYLSLAASAAAFTSAMPLHSGKSRARRRADAVCRASRLVAPVPTASRRRCVSGGGTPGEESPLLLPPPSLPRLGLSEEVPSPSSSPPDKGNAEFPARSSPPPGWDGTSLLASVTGMCRTRDAVHANVERCTVTDVPTAVVADRRLEPIAPPKAPAPFLFADLAVADCDGEGSPSVSVVASAIVADEDAGLARKSNVYPGGSRIRPSICAMACKRALHTDAPREA
mmetsp:Transcript_57810/g.172572  ORF Transcript_57810/g.172572 Transcript_57810/m.172572 type:complete len:244 (-) Transcript_57810:633-1364(-)